MFFKKNKKSVFKILIIFLIFIGSIISIVFGSIGLSKNSEQNGLFGDNYSFSFQVDTSSAIENKDKLQVAKQASDAFANWLLYKNIYSSSIQYGTTTLSGGKMNGIVYSNIQNIPTITYRNVVREQNPNWIALTTLNDSRVTIQQYNPNGNLNFGTGSNYKYSPILSQSDIIANSAIIDTRTTNNVSGVRVDLNKDIDISIFNSEKNQATPPTSPTQWFVFQNLDILVKKLNYAKYIAYLYNDPTKNTEEITFYYETLPADYQSWALASINGGSNTDIITNENILMFYVDSKSSATDPNANSNLTAIVETYLLSQNATNKAIEYSNYNDWFPSAALVGSSTRSKSPSTIATEFISRISFQNSSDIIQKDLLYQFQNTVIESPLSIEITPSIADYFTRNPLNSYISKSYLQDSVINNFSSYQMIFLSFGAILLILSIVISILYRIPGVFGSLAMISAIIFSAAFLFLLNINFSIPSIIAIFIGLVILLTSFIVYMERIRKLIRERNSIFDSLMSSFKKSFWTFVDIHVVALLSGLMFSLIGKLELVDFGLTLILISLVSFACFSLFFLVPFYFLAGSKNLWNYRFFLLIRKNYNNRTIKFDIKNKVWIIVISVLLIIFIIFFSLISTLGINNSIVFNDGSVIYIGLKNISIANDIINLLPGNWNDIVINNNILSASSATIITSQELTNILTGFQADISSIDVGVYSPIASIDLLKTTAYALLASFAISSVYYFVRLNIFISIPLFIVNCFSSLFFVSFFYLTYLEIDSLFIYALIFISLVSNVFLLVSISVSKTRFIKHQIFHKDDIANFIKINLWSNTRIILFSVIFICLSSALFLGLISPKTIWLFAYILIGTIVVMPLTIYLGYFAYYWIILFRQIYIKNALDSIENKFKNKNYFESDEEIIQSINKFN